MRRWSILGEAIPHSVGEAVRFSAMTPGSELLRGSGAGRGEVLDRWESVDRIYLATHFVTEPERPYVTRIPLAADVDGTESLGRDDILAADLSRCGLVVLSGCASGARDRSGPFDLPGLADLFLAAGARAVIGTGWNVGDAGAAELMHAFNERHAGRRLEPVAALAAARRELIRRGAPPQSWAAYTILLDGPAEAGVPTTKTESAWNRLR